MNKIELSKVSEPPPQKSYDDALAEMGALFGAQLGPEVKFITTRRFRGSGGVIRVTHPSWDAAYEFNPKEDNIHSVIEVIKRDQGIGLAR